MCTPHGEGSTRATDLLRMSSRVRIRSRPAMHQKRCTDADSGLRTTETNSRRSSGRLDGPGLPGTRRRTNKTSLLANDPDDQNSAVINGASAIKVFTDVNNYVFTPIVILEVKYR